MSEKTTEIELAKVEYSRDSGYWTGTFSRMTKSAGTLTINISLQDQTRSTEIGGYPPVRSIEQVIPLLREKLHENLQALVEASTLGLRKSDSAHRKSAAE